MAGERQKPRTTRLWKRLEAMRHPWSVDGVGRRAKIKPRRLRSILNGEVLPTRREAERLAVVLGIKLDSIDVQTRGPGRPPKLPVAAA